MSERDDALDLLALNWDRPPWNPQLATHYDRRTEDVPDVELLGAVDHLVKVHSGWRPDVAMIRATVVERRGLFPSEAEAARSAAEYMDIRRHYDANGTASEFPVVHPLVRDAALAAGTDHQASFVKAYREIVARAVSDIQAGDLSQPTLYSPVRVVGDHVPPRFLWVRSGWYTLDGRPWRLDRGDPAPARIEAATVATPAALPFGDT